MRAIVDLPLPLSPTRPKTSPGWIENETWSTAVNVRWRHLSIERTMKKSIDTSSTSTRGPPSEGTS